MVVLMLQLREVVRRMLERAGFRVYAFGSPEELLQVAGAIDPAPNLLLSDIVLPKMNGSALARVMREKWPSLRVLLMSGYAPAEEPGLAEVSDARFLRKPFSPAELVASVAEMLAAPQQDAPKAAREPQSARPAQLPDLVASTGPESRATMSG